MNPEFDANGRSQPFEYYVVLDFEATCDSGNPLPVQEVIEFPSVLVRSKGMQVVDEFAAFVLPRHYPVLSPFCIELTGIRQEDVDQGLSFPETLTRHTAWLKSHGLAIDNSWDSRYAFVLCGDWDLGTMFPAQCRACDPPITEIPRAYRQWVNIKRPFAEWKGVSKSPGMDGMLRELGLELVGRHHRGIDDCRNIARISRALVDRGSALAITTRLAVSRYPPLRITLCSGDESHEVSLTSRSSAGLIGLASGAFRRQVMGVKLDGGNEIDGDEDLLSLPQDLRD